MSSIDKVSLPKLKGSGDYVTWSIRLKAALVREDLLSTIEGNSQEPKNSKGVAIIKLLCEDGPLLYIKDISNATEAWNKLENIYNSKGFTTEFLTLKRFFNTSLDDFDSMEEYLFEVKALVDDLKSKEIVLPKQAVMAWVLNSLSPEYEGFISNITQALRHDPNSYSTENLFSSLIDEARGKENNNKLLFTQKERKGSNKAYKKLGKGNFCQHCKLSSHRTDSCFFLFPDKAPKGWKIKKNQKNQKNQQKQSKEALITSLSKIDTSDLLGSSDKASQSPPSDNHQVNITSDSSHQVNTIGECGEDHPMPNLDDEIDQMLDNNLFNDMEVCLPCYNYKYPYKKAVTDNQLDGLVEKEYSDITLILDSAATINTVSDIKYFYSYKKVNKTVNWGKARTLKVKYQGDIYIRYKTGYIYHIKDAYYIPELGINLLSIHKMPDNIALFSGNETNLYTSNKEYIATGYKRNNLFELKASVLYPRNNNNSIYITREENTLYKWHTRLGHIGLIPLKIILDNKGIKISKEDYQDFLDNKCRICLLSKDNRKIYKESINPKDYGVLDRIHSDIGGPLAPTYDSYKYYITFLDKKSRYLWIILLQGKNQAYQAFENFKAIIENTNNNTIKEFFTDNGKEYINKRFKISLNKYGIIHNTTPAYTKEPNGLIERINLTILNKVRSFLIASNTPKTLWGEAMLSATYIYNRTPHKALNYKTPYEVYHNIKPNISHIKAWGSIAYYHTNNYIKKLSPRKEEAILIGYNDTNHYKLWDLNRQRTLWSRDVEILEGTYIKPDNDKGSNNYTYIDLSNLSDKPENNTSQEDNSLRPTTRSMTRTQEPTTHRIEVQIPQKDIYNYDNTLPVVGEDNRALYTIDDTIIGNALGSLDKEEEVADFLLTTTNIDEPNTFQEAMASPEKDEWLRACQEEVQELEKQYTYEIVNIPSDKIPLKGRWVFKKKPINNPNFIKEGHITNKEKTFRYKARWVIQGFYQKLGVDFLETFSPTCRTETWHLLLIIAINKGWYIIQFDVKNAFIHADIDATIYTILPTGIYNDPNKVCLLKKALYGLKQAPRLWSKYLSKALDKLGFTVFPYDEGIYINHNTSCLIICHVDDILIIHKDMKYINEISNKAQEYIKIEKIGSVSTFLGNDISINYDTKTLYINQNKYTAKILNKFGIYNKYKPVQIPGDPGIKLKKNNTQANIQDIHEYQKQIGSLLYLALKTRPDITFPVIYCSRFMSNPNKEHFNALTKIWKYLLAYPDLGLIWDCSGDNLTIKGYSDSDWGNDLDDRKSTSGYIFSLSGDIAYNNPISWTSQLQKSIALSSCEAEYMALKEATKEAIYLANMFNYLNNTLRLNYINSIPKILVDSDSAKKLAENPEFHKRSKHIEITYHFTRQAIIQGKIELIHIPARYQLADLLTKNVNNLLHKTYITMARLGNNI